MLDDKFLGFINKRPLIILHYFLLGLVVFLAHWTSSWLEKLVMLHGGIYWGILYLWYVAFLLIFDNLIHLILNVD
jgi:hypothetical protein